MKIYGRSILKMEKRNCIVSSKPFDIISLFVSGRILDFFVMNKQAVHDFVSVSCNATVIGEVKCYDSA